MSTTYNCSLSVLVNHRHVTLHKCVHVDDLIQLQVWDIFLLRATNAEDSVDELILQNLDTCVTQCLLLFPLLCLLRLLLLASTSDLVLPLSHALALALALCVCLVSDTCVCSAFCCCAVLHGTIFVVLQTPSPLSAWFVHAPPRVLYDMCLLSARTCAK